MTSLRAAVGQFDIQLFEPEANAAKAAAAVADAAAAGCRLVVLPELANIGYVATWSAAFASDYYRFAEKVPGPFTEAMIVAAARGNIHIVVGVAERHPTLDGVLLNTALLITPDGKLHKYHKIHLPREEKRYFAEGSHLEPFTTDLGNIGVLVCADNSFPESARLLALRGAQVIAIPYTAQGTANPVLYHQMAAVRAYENQLFVALANRCGQQDSVVFAGTSAIAAPDGTLLAQLDTDPGLAWADLELDLLVSERLRQTRYRDRRPHLYREIAEG
jgi:predicted amidohydrolase